MAHIDERRIMELALGAVSRSGEESLHLGSCAECRAALDAEADLSATLTAAPMVVPPVHLAEQINEALAAQFAARASRAPLVALAVTTALLAPLAVLLLGRWTELVARMGSCAVVMRVLTQLVFAHGSAPLVVTVQAAMLLGGLAVLTRLLRTTALVPEVMR